MMKTLLLYLLLASAAHAATFSHDDPNCANWTMNSAGVISCTTAPPPVCPPPQTGAPPNCVTPAAPVCSALTASPSTLGGGGATTLTAFCTGRVTGYTWSASTPPVSGFYAVTFGNVQVTTISNSTTFGAQAWNDSLGSNIVSVPVTVNSGQIACAGFTNTAVVSMDWNNPTRQYTGNVAQTDAIVVKFTTGALSAGRTYGNVTGAESGSPATQRVSTLSATPCDLASPPVLGYGAQSNGSTAYIVFTLPPNDGGGYYPVLKSGATYYLNVKTTGNCGNCNMYFDLSR